MSWNSSFRKTRRVYFGVFWWVIVSYLIKGVYERGIFENKDKQVYLGTHIGFLVLGTVIMIMATYSDCIMFSLIHIKLAESDHFIGHFCSKIFCQNFRSNFGRNVCFFFNFWSQRKENFIFLTIFDNLERGIILNEYYVLDSVARDFSFLI